MDLNARVNVHCGRKDGRTDGLTENRTPISHLAKADATTMEITLGVCYYVYLNQCINVNPFMSSVLCK